MPAQGTNIIGNSGTRIVFAEQPISQNPVKELLTIDELSEYLGVKKSTLYSKVEGREIPFYKIGHLVRFRKAEIDA